MKSNCHVSSSMSKSHKLLNSCVRVTWDGGGKRRRRRMKGGTVSRKVRSNNIVKEGVRKSGRSKEIGHQGETRSKGEDD